VLAKLFPEHSRSRLQGWLKDGLIRLDGAEVEAKRKVYGGERIEFAAAPVPRTGCRRRLRRRRLRRCWPKTSRSPWCSRTKR
jgi:23S rRNA-/tRNA-specific pseudouridylate synthase